MRRLRRRLPHVPRSVVAVLTLALCVFLMAGGVYMLVDKPPFMLSTSWGAIRPIMRGTGQTVYEGIISALLYGALFAGLYMCFKAAGSYNPRMARILMATGILVSILGLAGLYYMIWVKF